jgi:hypothetical protein
VVCVIDPNHPSEECRDYRHVLSLRGHGHHAILALLRDGDSPMMCRRWMTNADASGPW